MFYNSIAEMDCWADTLEDEGYIVTRKNPSEICYEEDGEIYDSDDIPDIDCKCSGCEIYR